MPNINQLNKLIEQFGKLPGVGAKTAQKMAYFILAQNDSVVKEFADTLLASKNMIHCCPRCQNLTDQALCPICGDEKRKGAICVVEKPEDVEAMERTRTFHGTYHVLHGLISPVNGIGADQLKIRELLHRVAEEPVEEVILGGGGFVATNSILYRTRIQIDRPPFRQMSHLDYFLQIQ